MKGLFRVAFLTPILFVFATPISHAETPLFVIDTANILKIATKAAYEHNPDLSEGDLVVDKNGFFIFCSQPNSKPAATTGTGAFTECRARLSFQVRPTIKQDVIALANGLCSTHREHSNIDITVHSDGRTSVSGGNGTSVMEGSCEN